MSLEQLQAHLKKLEGARPNPYSLVGNLPDWAVKEFIRDGYIKINPLKTNWEEELGPLAIDFHLGRTLKRFKTDGRRTIDTQFTTKEQIEELMQPENLQPGQPFVLDKNDFVIAPTLERLTLPDDIVGHLDGKSSLARLGIVVHSTAARFDPGWDGCPVLEIGTFLPADKECLLYAERPICAFRFEKLPWKIERSYHLVGRFGGSTEAKVADFSKNGNGHNANLSGLTAVN